MKMDGLQMNGAQLKWLAVITMIIDHIAAAQVVPGIVESQRLYDVCRGIGRVSFPIFCFLLVEGFLFTKDVKKYLLRLLIFAFISEVPFDLAFYHSAFYPGAQNVFFTLFLGLATICLMQKMIRKGKEDFLFLVFISGAILTEMIFADYGFWGIILICACYLLHDRPGQKNLAIGLWCLIESPVAIFSLLPINQYNGQKGKQMKYLFYLIYPLHLVALYLCAYISVFQ